MSRVVSIYLPDLPTDRIRRADPSIPPEQPIAVIAKSGSKRWVSAADPAARKAGVHVGMAAAKALFRGLMMVDADLEVDRVALERITLWALTIYSPIVAVDGIDGIVMDTEGADHLQGGELPMVTKIANQFLGRKLTARVAVADSWCVLLINTDVPAMSVGALAQRLLELETFRLLALLFLPEAHRLEPAIREIETLWLRQPWK